MYTPSGSTIAERLAIEASSENLVVRSVAAPGHSWGAFEGRSHYTVGLEGWEEVADYALDWAPEHATRRQQADTTA